MLKVSPWKGVIRFDNRGKLNPRYVGPFKVIAKVGKLAYRLELPQEFSKVHHTFHVSNLKKCYVDEPLVMPLEGIHVDDKLQFVKKPIKIMEREIILLKRSRIPLVKVCWNSRRGPEFTWEREDSKRISDKRTKNEAKNDKTKHGMEKREKSKSKSTKMSTKSKSKSTPTKVKVKDRAETEEKLNGLTRSGYQQKDRKPSQNDKTEHGMEKTVQNQGQSPKMPKSESILKNTVGCNLNPSDGPGKPN
ncbi:hypothetical protein Tco_1159009, partial [Tanacetum coccineum]